MAEHCVRVKAPTLDLGKVDMVFQMKRGGLAHGKLKVSKGGVEWMQRGHRETAFELSWGRVDEIFRAHGREVKTHSNKWD